MFCLTANIDDLANDLIGLNGTFIEPNYLNDQDVNKIEDDSNVLINNNPTETLNELQAYKQENQSTDKSIQPACSVANTSATQLDSDNYIHELLSDEDLQMIGFPNLQTNLPILEDLVQSVDDLNDNLNNLELTNEDYNEASSDSAVSSMSRSVKKAII